MREVNLEHIFPKNPSDEWANVEELEPYLEHMGNYTMLGERLNNKAQSFGFAKKKDQFYAKSELKMVKQIVSTYSSWDKATVEAHAKELAPAVVRIWSFDNPSGV